MGPGNVATSCSKSCTSTGLCCCVQLQQRVLHAVALEHAQPLNSNPTHSHVAVWFALWTPSHKQALSLLPSSRTQQQGQLVLSTLTPHVGHPACFRPVPPKCIKWGWQLIFKLNRTPHCFSNNFYELLVLLHGGYITMCKWIVQNMRSAHSELCQVFLKVYGISKPDKWHESLLNSVWGSVSLCTRNVLCSNKLGILKEMPHYCFPNPSKKHTLSHPLHINNVCTTQAFRSVWDSCRGNACILVPSNVTHKSSLLQTVPNILR